MASSIYAVSLFSLIIVLRIWSSSSSFLPFFDDVCKTSDQCGKGTCKPTNESTFGFVCVCDAGWKQTRSEHDDDLKYLPCVIPNCTVNYSCAEAPAPAPHVNRSNKSIFDPCFWVDCGGGTCNKTSPFTHACVCQTGYDNIFNVSAFPCFRDCSLGADCNHLGIGLNNKSASSSSHPNLADNSQNQGGSLVPRLSTGDFSWLILSVLSLALVMCA